jgi:4-amino-4-deoxy-L-arabinose transferase-like glycosyltransferase
MADSRSRVITLVGLIALLLLALGLRLAPWGQNRFLEDEALYGYWGLQIATGTDPMLDLEPVDKPPLYPYTLAFAFLVSGTTTGGLQAEAVAKLPSLLASLAGIALTYGLGSSLYHDRWTGLLAAGLLALSAFDLLFASTAFTDPLLVSLVLAALLAASCRNLPAAGLLAGLALATKQQALIFLPLIIAVGVLSRARSPQSRHASRFARVWHSGWPAFALTLVAVLAAVLWWDSARIQRPGFLEQSLISYGGLGPARPASLAQRAGEWLRLTGYFWASPWFNLLWAGATVTWLAGWAWGWAPAWTRFDLLLAGFVLSFLAIHWLLGFQVWDRYLLGIVPLAALLAARAFTQLGRALPRHRWQGAYALALPAILALLLATPVLAAAHSELPVGGDHGAYDGIEDLAAYVRAQAPAGSTLYHHWLGYHYRFYLYGAPLRLHWYPDAADLVQDATIYRREPRYLAFPSFRDAGPARQATDSAGITLLPEYKTRRRDGSVSFRLYHLEGP